MLRGRVTRSSSVATDIAGWSFTQAAAASPRAKSIAWMRARSRATQQPPPRRRHDGRQLLALRQNVEPDLGPSFRRAA
jgi:hypothetical protein